MPGRKSSPRPRPRSARTCTSEAQRSGQETVVAISLSSLPAETMRADGECRGLGLFAGLSCPVEVAPRAGLFGRARRKCGKRERQAFEAQTRFELLRDRRLRALASVRPVAPPQPATIENPRWTEICRRLADLEEREEGLAVRTHAAASFRAGNRNADRGRASRDGLDSAQDHAGAARRSQRSRRRPAPCRPTAPAATEVQAAQQAAEQLKQDLQQAQAAGACRTHGARRGTANRSLRRGTVAPASPRRCVPPLTILGKALVTATTSIVGLGMISFGGLAGAGAIEHRRIAGPLARAHRGRDSGHASRPPSGRIGPAPASCPLGLDDRRAGRAVGGRVAFLPRLSERLLSPVGPSCREGLMRFRPLENFSSSAFQPGPKIFRGAHLPRYSIGPLRGCGGIEKQGPSGISYKAHPAVDSAPKFASRSMFNSLSCARGICATAAGRGDLSIAKWRGF